VRPEDEQRIQAAVERGALSPGRADYWRARAAMGEDVSIVDELASARPPQPIRAAAPGRRYVDVAAARAPAGADPALFASNGLLAEVERSHPALVAAARSEGPPPELFGDAPLPPFTASGLPPEQLASLPWPLRRPVAAATSLADAWRMVDRYMTALAEDAAAERAAQAADPYRPPVAYSGGPELAALKHARENLDYVERFSAWLRGNGVDAGTVSPLLASGDPDGRLRAEAEADAADLTGQALYDELFAPPPPVRRSTF
jgi:hypothetical protein